MLSPMANPAEAAFQALKLWECAKFRTLTERSRGVSEDLDLGRTGLELFFPGSCIKWCVLTV